MSTRVFRWGSYPHPDQEVRLDRAYKRAKFTKRGLRESTIRGMFLKGWVVADSESALNQRIADIDNAYAADNYDAVLLNDGAPGPHSLLTSDVNCLTGVKVVDFQWTYENPTETLNNRSFTVQLEGEFLDPASQVLFWYEQIEYIGNFGSRWESVEFPVDDPVDVYNNLVTTQRVIQSGNSLGYLGYVPSYGSLWPGREHQEQRREIWGDPDRNGNGFTHYPFNWAYYHTLTSPAFSLPSLEPH